MTTGSHSLIQRFIKAAFQTRQAFPKYQTDHMGRFRGIKFSEGMALCEYLVPSAPLL